MAVLVTMGGISSWEKSALERVGEASRASGKGG